jgi:hypothetical protein
MKVHGDVRPEDMMDEEDLIVPQRAVAGDACSSAASTSSDSGIAGTTHTHLDGQPNMSGATNATTTTDGTYSPDSPSTRIVRQQQHQLVKIEQNQHSTISPIAPPPPHYAYAQSAAQYAQAFGYYAPHQQPLQVCCSVCRPLTCIVQVHIGGNNAPSGQAAAAYRHYMYQQYAPPPPHQSMAYAPSPANLHEW